MLYILTMAVAPFQHVWLLCFRHWLHGTFRRLLKTFLFTCYWHTQHWVNHQLETVHSPLQVHERGTVYRQLSAQPPNRSLLSKKNLNRFFLDSHFSRDNVNFNYVKHSSKSLYHIIALNGASYLDYITLHWPKLSEMHYANSLIETLTSVTSCQHNSRGDIV